VREIGGKADETHRNEVFLSQREDDDEGGETRLLKEDEIDANVPCTVGNLQSASHDA
jgi:hypothetical protein